MSGPSSPELVSLSFTIGDEDVVLSFDASLNEQHGGQAQVSEHPVEKGPNITDNVRPLPRRVSLEAMVSNTPIYKDVPASSNANPGNEQATIESVTIQPPLGLPRSTQKMTALAFDDEFNRVRDVYNSLVVAYQAGALITVITTLQDYDNMVIVNLSVPRNAQNSNASVFTIDMQQLVLVEVNAVDTLAEKHQEKNRGPKPNKPEAEEPQKAEEARSALKGIVRLFSGAH